MPKDVKVVRALINVYLRTQSKQHMPVSGKNDGTLEKAISDFQVQYLKFSKADGRVDVNGTTFKGLINVLNGVFKRRAISVPDYGVVTWASEGTEGGRYHSRKLHVPSHASGLTLGRGYDFRSKNKATISRDLTSAGVSAKIAAVLEKASGLFGNSAEQFIIEHDLLDFEISPEVQKKLFKISYDAEAAEVKRICAKYDVEEEYGVTNWDALNPFIKDLIVDLKFRGDYTPSVRRFLQKSIADNDLAEFKKQIKNKSNWSGVPGDRYNRRVNYIDKAN